MSSTRFHEPRSQDEPPADLVIGPAHNGMPMTPDEFDAHQEWDELYVYELVNGVLIVNPPPLEQERDPNEELGHWLRTYRDHHPQGSTLDATLSEHLVRIDRNRRRADRVIWAGLGRRPNPRVDLPTIVVEFVSEGRRNWKRDYVTKRDEYLSAGVSEYWVIDRFQRSLTVFRLLHQTVSEQIVRGSETYRPDLLPGFELSLSRLLSLADWWEEK